MFLLQHFRKKCATSLLKPHVSPTFLLIVILPNGSLQLPSSTHELLSQDAVLFVCANSSIVFCFLHCSLSRMKLHRPPDLTPLPSPHCPFHVNENAVFLLLYQMTRKCVTLTLEDNTPPPHTQISTKCPFNAVRKYDRRECEEGAVLAGTQVPSRVVGFDAVAYKVIIQGVKRPFFC